MRLTPGAWEFLAHLPTPIREPSFNPSRVSLNVWGQVGFAPTMYEDSRLVSRVH